MRTLWRCLLLATLVAMSAQTLQAADTPFVVVTETIKGMISAVDVPNNLLILSAPDRASYAFQVQKTTSIQIGLAKAKMEDLAGQTGKEAKVTFKALRMGDVALKIEVQ